MTALVTLGKGGTATKRLELDLTRLDRTHGQVLRALANETRVAILKLLAEDLVPVSEIAERLGLPPSTATMHISILQRAGLVHSVFRPASRGVQKLCTRLYDEIVIQLPNNGETAGRLEEISVPVGSYADCRVTAPCGLAGPTGLIGFIGDPNSFWEPARVTAQLLWFGSGYVEYRLPNRLPAGCRVRSIEIRAELCSEAPGSDPDWPSDIGLYVNDTALGTWTSPADFGGQRGRLTPDWWEVMDTQYGILKCWRADQAGTQLDGERLSATTVGELHLEDGEPIRVRIGVDPKASNVGGVNIFGATFGNHPQDIVVRIECE